MAHDGPGRSLRLQRLLKLSDELRELSELVQRFANDGNGAGGDLLAKNLDLVRRCDDLAAEMAGS